MREIAHNWISSVRIKVNASRVAAATASAAQSEDRSANQKTTFFGQHRSTPVIENFEPNFRKGVDSGYSLKSPE
jgi:hypothetical protein